MKPLILTDRGILSQPSGGSAPADKRKLSEALAAGDARSELSRLVGELVAPPRREALLALLEAGEFWRAPASSRANLHGAFAGGLAIHTLLVVRHLRALNAAWEAGLAEESLVVAGVVHDVSKGGVDGKPYYLGEGAKFRRNPELPAMGQAALSLYACAKAGLALSAQEFQAVMGQDGMASEEGKSVFESGRNPFPLTYLLHMSDWYVAGVLGF